MPRPRLATLEPRIAFTSPSPCCLRALPRPRLILTSMPLVQGSPPPRLPALRPRLAHTSPLPHPPLNIFWLRFARASPPLGRGLLSPCCPWAEDHPILTLTSPPLSQGSPSHCHCLALPSLPSGRGLPMPCCSQAEAHPHLALASPSPHCLLVDACPCLAALGLRLTLASPSTPMD